MSGRSDWFEVDQEGISHIAITQILLGQSAQLTFRYNSPALTHRTLASPPI